MPRKEWRWIWGGVVLGVVGCCLVFAGYAFAAGDENELVCPTATVASPGYRSYLPDCRAYEQVSPVFKQGAQLQTVAVSENGEHVVMQSLGAFAGLEGGDTGAAGGTYELSRSASGWLVSPLSPPASLLPTQYLDAVSSDLGGTLFNGRTGSESAVADNFYLREADGAIAEVGPLLPPSATGGPAAGEFDIFNKPLNYYVDASADLSHIFYRMDTPPFEGDEWPGDTTIGSESLLEYSGTGNPEPELVGVKPGPGEEKDKPSENPALISTCGTSLGSLGSKDVYNAVSGDGASVFFMAQQGGCHENGMVGSGPEVNELYARVGGRETVAISEPSVGDCGACDTGVKGSAEFVGASEDGSKVFFLTSQELLAGASGPSLYEYDFDNLPGEKIVPVSVGSASPEVQGVARVSEDGSHVYFVAQGVLTTEPDRSLPVGHQKAEAGGDNLYVFERDAEHPAGKVSFIAMLCSGENKSGERTGVTQCPSAESDAKDWGQTDHRRVQATPDGRFLVFQSVADLVEGDTSSLPQIFEYDAQAGELVRVSRGADGDEPQGTENANASKAEINSPDYVEPTSPAAAGTGLAVSDDGSVVVFSDGGALTVGAEAGTSAYEYRSSVGVGGSVGDGDVYLVGPPASPEVQLDGSGRDVFFLSGVSLVPQDSDSQFALYDARVDGGFPEPVAPVECGGAGCTSAVAQSLVTPSGSAGVVGGGNLAPSPPPAVVVGGKPVVRSLTRAQKLARALKACKKDKRKATRVSCERVARKRYGVARRASGGRGAGR